jgi:hypothetical protein
MKFDKLVKSLLNEAPIAAFSTKEGLPVSIDLKIKDQYATDYIGFISYIKQVMSQLDPDSKNKFLEELKNNEEFKNTFDYFYTKNGNLNKTITDFYNDINQ